MGAGTLHTHACRGNHTGTQRYKHAMVLQLGVLEMSFGVITPLLHSLDILVIFLALLHTAVVAKWEMMSICVMGLS